MKSKKVDIFGTKYNIMFTENPIDPDGERFSWGINDSCRKKILIATKDIDGKPINDDEIRLTVFHELVHAILGEGQYKSCTEDEPLVEWIAKCFNSFVKQGIITVNI